MTDDLLDDFERREVTHRGSTKTVFEKGSGPGVLVMTEIPGITPPVADFARRLVDDGFRVAMPDLFGTPGRERTMPYVLRSITGACVSKEFVCLATGERSPVTDWLLDLAHDLHETCGGPGVGAVGMCLTGGFALAMMIDDVIRAPVLSQPSLPLAIGGARRRDLGISTEELAVVSARAGDGCPVLGLRFSEDAAAPAERFARLSEVLGDGFVGVVIDSSPGNEHGFAKSAHSVLTEEFEDSPDHPTRLAYDRVVAHLRAQLSP